MLRRCGPFPISLHSICAASVTLRTAEAAFDLPNVHANQQIAYRYPVDLPELVSLRERWPVNDEEIEEMIEDGIGTKNRTPSPARSARS